MNWTDKELGMDSHITRRDFMQGAAMTIAAAVTPPTSLFAQQAAEAQNTPGYDPPAAHGLRGSHPAPLKWPIGYATAASGLTPESLKAPAKATT